MYDEEDLKRSGTVLNNLDLSGVLQTYAEKCRKARNDEHLKELVRELKKELSSEEIKKLKVLRNS